MNTRAALIVQSLVQVINAIPATPAFRCQTTPQEFAQLRERAVVLEPIMLRREEAPSKRRALKLGLTLRSRMEPESATRSAFHRLLEDAETLYDAIGSAAAFGAGGAAQVEHFARGDIALGLWPGGAAGQAAYAVIEFEAQWSE